MTTFIYGLGVVAMIFTAGFFFTLGIFAAFKALKWAWWRGWID